MSFIIPSESDLTNVLRELPGKLNCVKQLGDTKKQKVYLCVDSNGKQVVIKCTNPLAGEIYKTVQSLSITSIFKVSSIIEYRDKTWVVMPYATGGDLGSLLTNIYLKKTCIDERTACRIARSLVVGLMEIHNGGVLHRDIKPENIYLVFDDSEGCWRFLYADLDGSSIRTSIKKLRDENHIGTLEFIRVTWDLLTWTTDNDIFALALVLFWLFTGFPVHHQTKGLGSNFLSKVEEEGLKCNKLFKFVEERRLGKKVQDDGGDIQGGVPFFRTPSLSIQNLLLNMLSPGYFDLSYAYNILEQEILKAEVPFLELLLELFCKSISTICVEYLF